MKINQSIVPKRQVWGKGGNHQKGHKDVGCKDVHFLHNSDPIIIYQATPVNIWPLCYKKVLSEPKQIKDVSFAPHPAGRQHYLFDLFSFNERPVSADRYIRPTVTTHSATVQPRARRWEIRSTDHPSAVVNLPHILCKVTLYTLGKMLYYGTEPRSCFIYHH